MNIAQNHKIPISKLAEKYGRSERQIRYDLKKLGFSKTREQYEANACTRRKTAYELRQSGLKWREVAEVMGISVNNAQKLGERYKKSLTDTPL